jgi:hypothetical protein
MYIYVYVSVERGPGGATYLGGYVCEQLVQVSRRLKRSRETRVYEDKLKEMGFAPDGKSLPK